MPYTSTKQVKYVPDGNAVLAFQYSPYYEPERVCYIDPSSGQRLLYSQVRQATLRFATILRHKFHVKRNDVVMLSTVNSIYLQVIHHAILSLGAIVSPANVHYTTKELAHQISSVKPIMIIASDMNSAKGALGVAGHSAKVVSHREISGLIMQVAKHRGVAMAHIEHVDGSTQPAYYVQSSGTSGLPKTVVLTHTNIAVNMLQWVQQGSAMDMPFAICGSVLPLSHMLGLQVYLWTAPFVGATTVVFEKFDLEPLCQAICKYKIQTMAVVPPIVLAFARNPVIDKYPVAESLKFFTSAAAPLPLTLIEAVEKRIPGLSIEQFYGQSETAPLSIGCADSASLGPLTGKYTRGSVGWVAPSTEIRLVDPETLTDTQTNRGEIWVRGPQVMPGYLNNPEANASTFVDGWLRTGDIAEIDASGQFVIVDRIKELIKSKGHQVAPAELEGRLLEHPSVQDCAVIGVSDKEGVTENPRAYVVLKKGTDPLQVAHDFNSQVAVHKRLWGGVVPMDAIPKSPSGKILRRLLREAARTHKAVGRELAQRSVRAKL